MQYLRSKEESHTFPRSNPNRGVEMKRILVCEDEDVIRDFVVINLKRAGYDVCDVGCGEDALRVFEEEHGNFDIVLLDIMMPGIDGFTVCKKLREKSSTIGIIMLTARTQEMDKVSGLMFGADDYITKPFSPLGTDCQSRRDLSPCLHELYQGRTVAGDRKRPLYPESEKPHRHQKRQADRPDTGGIPDHGVFP